MQVIVFRKPCAQPNKKIKPPFFSIVTISPRNSLREIFYSTRTCGNSSLQQNYVWGKTTEKQPLFSSIKRREWDSLDKIAMLDIRNGDSDVLLWAKLEDNFRMLAALMKSRGSLALDFQSYMNNTSICVKNWNKRTNLSAPNIRFQQAFG